MYYEGLKSKKSCGTKIKWYLNNQYAIKNKSSEQKSGNKIYKVSQKRLKIEGKLR